jgi:hypothetical protein
MRMVRSVLMGNQDKEVAMRPIFLTPGGKVKMHPLISLVGLTISGIPFSQLSVPHLA